MLLKSVRDQQTDGTFGFSPKTPALPNITSPIVPTKSPRNMTSRSLSEMSVALDPVALAKRVLERLLSEQTIGMIDYIRSRDPGADRGPFNGQNARQALFVDIIANTS